MGIVDSLPAAQKAARLPEGTLDYLEWRADFLGTKIPKSRLPWVITARHPAEGGMNALSAEARRSALLTLLPYAAVVDIEVRSLSGMKAIVASTHATGAKVVASFHDFKKTPTTSRLKDIIHRASDAGADAVKIATFTRSASDVARLLDLWATSPLPLALMGMGPLGMASRLLFANCGSILNYGWLHSPNVPGQWSAVELKSLIQKSQS